MYQNLLVCICQTLTYEPIYVTTQREPLKGSPWQPGWHMPHEGGKAGRRVFADHLTLNILTSCTEKPTAALPAPWGRVLLYTMEMPSVSDLAWGWTSSMDTLPCKIPHYLTFLSKSAPPLLAAGPFLLKAVVVIQEYLLPKRNWARTELAECLRLQAALGPNSDSHRLLPALCMVPVMAWHNPCLSHVVPKCPCRDRQRGPLLVLPWEVRSRVWYGDVCTMAPLSSLSLLRQANSHYYIVIGALLSPLLSHIYPYSGEGTNLQGS